MVSTSKSLESNDLKYLLILPAKRRRGKRFSG